MTVALRSNIDICDIDCTRRALDFSVRKKLMVGV